LPCFLGHPPFQDKTGHMALHDSLSTLGFVTTSTASKPAWQHDTAEIYEYCLPFPRIERSAYR
jgi:hypothetical protein